MTTADQVELFGRLAAALALGAAIGLQREFRGHDGGIRTSSFVCVGAALFGEVGAFLADPRVAAAVVQGIGFLGAGLIFQRESSVHGVTTAATMWVLAGIGLLVALHLWLVAVLLSAGVVILLELAPLSSWVYHQGQRRRARLRPGGDSADDIG